MSNFSSTTSASAKSNTALQTLQDLLQAFRKNQGLSLSRAFPIFGTKEETVLQPEERLFNERLAFQGYREIETEESPVVLIPQQKEEKLPQLQEIQELTVTIAVPNELVVQGQQTTLVVTTLVDENDGGFGGTGLSLREAILIASDGDTIIFDPNLNNGLTTNRVINLNLGELVIDKSLTINGDLDSDDSTRDITVNANGRSRVFNVDDGNVSNQSTVSINGLNITGGATLGSGGGIHSIELLNLANVNVFGNSSSLDGGGIFIGLFTTAEITDSLVTGNSAELRGGGIAISYAGAKIINTIVTGNSATSGGGIDTYLSSPNIIDTTVSGNSANSGGGINLFYSSGIIVNTFVTGNSAASGGGIRIIDSKSETIQSISTIANSIVTGNSTLSHGGGIFQSSGTVKIVGSILSSNSADGSGGGIYKDSGITEITSSTIFTNSALSNGGGISQRSGTSEIVGSTISGNSASNNGGGFYNGSTSSTVVMDSIILDNSADNGGGGYNIDGSSAIVINSQISDNSASNSGGGIHSRDSSTIVRNSTISSNVADNNGGGISLRSGTTEITNSTISGNSASNNGGGINSIVSSTEVVNSTISDNSASNNGGGIYNQLFSNTTVTNSTISGNSAGMAGGGIHNTYGSTANINNSTLSDNAADIGGGTYTSGIDFVFDSTTNLSSSLISGNRATSVGDEIVTVGTSIVNANDNNLFGDSSQSNNTAFSGFTPGVNDINATSDGINVALTDILDTLANNGGSTLTHALVAGSPAIDAANNPLGLDNDQRGDGFSRSIGGGVDIGAFESEFLPGAIVVDTLEDENDGNFDQGDRSLREALIRIADGGTITFAPGLNNGITTDGVITLSLGELVIDKSVTIDGDLDGDDSTRDITIDADGNSRVFRIDDGDDDNESAVNIDGLIITGAEGPTRSGGGIYNGDEFLILTNATISGNLAGMGGGVFNYEGKVNVANSIISGNSATFLGGGIANYTFGSANVTITDSTISGNSARSGGGLINYNGNVTIANSTISSNSTSMNAGGIFSVGALTEVVNSTISNNSASNNGGGIRSIFSDDITITSSTISGNSADIAGGIYIGNGSEITLSNSVISGNRATSVGDEIVIVDTSIVNANDNNLLGDSSQSNNTAFSGFTPGVNDINTTSDGINVALTDILDPTLANNGGSTLTHALVAGSPAIDAANNPLGLDNDQRGDGFSRSIGGGVDIGAFESEFLPSAIVVDTLEDENDGNFDQGDRSLREALIRIADGGTITFAPGLNNGITTDGVITLSLGELVIDKSLTIIGDLDGDDSTRDITIDADGNSRVFRIDDGDDDNESEINIDGLVITGGVASGDNFQDRSGGGIYNGDEFLILTNATISGNLADIGGGINQTSGILEINNSTISGNSANGSGGGIYAYSRFVALEINNSIISGNSAGGRGGGIYNFNGDTTEINHSTISGNSAGGNGGGILLYGATSRIRNSTISDNSSGRHGGGLYFLTFSSDNPSTITNSTISGNSAELAGGGIHHRGENTVSINNSTFSDNSADIGGGIYTRNESTTNLSNTIVSGNRATSVGDEVVTVDTSIVNANDNNLFGDSSQSNNTAFSGFTPGVNNINATSDGINVALTDILDPTLADNGGSTLTHALVSGSPAIDTGSNPQGLITDQRGFNREFDGDENGTATADIGAFEFQPLALIRVSLPDDNAADGITFRTPLSLFRDDAIDSDLVRPNFADTFQFINITNIGTEETLTISSIDINAPGVIIIPQGDFLLNPGETERVNLIYQPIFAGDDFDLDNGLVINSNAINDAAFEVQLSGRSTFNSDISYDGIVGTEDLDVFAANFGGMIGGPSFDPTTDINRDGQIDFADLGVLGAEFGQSLPSI